MSAESSYTEIEVKIRIADQPQAARERIEKLGYAASGPRILESDQLFDRPDGELQRSDRLLRLRRSGDHTIVTYKGPSTRERYKTREEIEFDVSDADAFLLTIERLGFAGRFRYEKYRTTFRAPGQPGLITLDETPIGVFLELEGPPEWIDRTAADLGFSPADYLTASYASLYRKYVFEHPGAKADMVF
ncbi:MAG: class IV adenylate cyclase [Bryobacteraceae bacterium]